MKEVKKILTGSPWNAGLEWYDYLCGITFKDDSTGQMASGNGQALRLAVDFKYKIRGNRMLLEFFDTTEEFWGQLFTRTEENAKHSVEFELKKGTFRVKEPYAGLKEYEYTLVFSESPFPVGDKEADRTLTTFLGWPKKDKK